MKRGRKPKNEAVNVLPETLEGDKISLSLNITRVSNGYIVENVNPDHTRQSTMVFNGERSHEAVTGYVLSLALSKMQEGEKINFESTLTYVKKITNEKECDHS